MSSRSIAITVALGLAAAALGVAAGRWAGGGSAMRTGPAPISHGGASPDAFLASGSSEKVKGAGKIETASRDSQPSAARSSLPAAGSPVAGKASQDIFEQWTGGTAVPGAKVQDLLRRIDARRRSDPGDGDGETQARLHAALESLWMDLRGQLPTATPDGKGEFTHPKVLATLAKEALSSADAALTGAQKDAILQAGKAYETACETASASYHGDTPRLVKIVDEVALKKEFLDGMLDQLDGRQRGILERYRSPGDPMGDLLSPLRMANVHIREISTEEATHLLDELSADLARQMRLSEEDSARIGRSMVRDLEPLLDPRRAASLDEIERALIAGHAFVRGLEEMLRLPALDPAVRRRLLELDQWPVLKLAEE